MNANIHELQARWPLFYLREQKDYYTDRIGFTVYLSPRNESDPGNIQSYVVGEIPKITVEGFDGWHEKLEIRNRYHKSYPNLWFYIDVVTLRPTGVWVRRDGRDGESICSDTDALQSSTILRILNKEAGKALQEGWFWCCNCDGPKPKSEYGYYHFSSKYCKKCKNENPTAYKRALAETYN